MPASPRDVLRHSPDKLLTGFSKTRVAWYFLIAVVIHIVAMAATSVGYIRDRWIDPEGAARRRVARLEAAKAEAEAAALRPPAPGPKPPAQGQTQKDRPKADTAAGGPRADNPEEARKDTPVMKGITDLPKKGEIPKEPDDLGISIEETNR